jgi:putative transposase
MWRDHGVSVGYREQSRQLTDARREHAWLRTMNALAQHGALKGLDRAYQAFFRRCAAGEAPGYPRFRSRRRAASITWPQHGNGCRVVQVGERNGRIELQGVGAVKFRAHRPLPLEAKLGQMTVKCVNGRWWVTIALELAACERSGGESDPGSARVVGLDVGVDELVALSTGERVRGPRIARARARAVRRAQRRVSRRRRGSLSRLRAVRTLARAQEQVADARRDHAHKVSRSLADRHAAIAVEDLDVRSMTRSARGTVAEPGRNVRAKAGLNRAIADSGWSQLRELLAYKLEDRGGQLVAVPAHHTSQTCAACGHRAAENRPSRSVFVCRGCGHREHADVNAARVIAQRGEEKLYGSGETRVEDAAMAAPLKPNPPPQSEPARALATPSGTGRDFHCALRTGCGRRLATPSGTGRDFHFDACRRR